MFSLAFITLLAFPAPYTVVLNDGSTITAKVAPVRKGSVALIRLPNGTLTSIPQEELDAAATTRANIAPAPGTVPLSKAQPAPKTGLVAAAAASRRKAAQDLTIDGGFPTENQTAATDNVTGTLGVGPASSSGRVAVRGYTRKNGTYVAPYTRSAPTYRGSSSGSSRGGGKH